MNKDLQIELLKKDVSSKDKEIDKVEEVFTSRGFTNIEQMATMFDYYKSRIDKAIEYIENKEINYATFNSKDLLDTGVGYDLWEILKGEENESN